MPSVKPRLFRDGEVVQLRSVVSVDEYAVHELLFFFDHGLAVLDIVVRLNDGLLGDVGDGLEAGGLDLSAQDGVAHVVGAVEAHDDDIGHAGVEAGLDDAHGHGVVAADDALDVLSALSLNDGLHHGVGLGLLPVGGLLVEHHHVGILIDDAVEALGADAGVGVGLLAQQFDVAALFILKSPMKSEPIEFGDHR